MLKSVEGHLEILDRRFGFLRSIERNFQPNPEDTFVPANLIQKFNLNEGVFIEGVGVRGDSCYVARPRASFVSRSMA